MSGFPEFTESLFVCRSASGFQKYPDLVNAEQFFVNSKLLYCLTMKANQIQDYLFKFKIQLTLQSGYKYSFYTSKSD